MSMPPPPPPPPPSRRDFLTLLSALPVLPVLASCEVGEVINTGNTATPTSINFDLTVSPYTRLAAPGGIVSLDAGTKRLLMIRSSDAAIVALDRLCTHQSCDLDPDAAGRFDLATGVIVCRCHNAHFSTNGDVLQGPATVPLRRYDVVFDAATGRGTVRLT